MVKRSAIILCLIISIAVSQEVSRCEPLEISACTEFGYGHVRFPNEIGQSTQEAASNDLNILEQFIATECSRDLKLFLCSLYAPYCNASSPLDFQIKPCRDLCLNVRDRCLKTMEEEGHTWPNSWKCGRFPSEKGKCVTGTEQPVTEKPLLFSTEAPLNPTTKPPTDPPKEEDDGITDTIIIDNSKNICRSDQMFCDGVCKPIAFRCDKYNDCEDGSDEQDCDKCLSTQFRCEDRSQCVPISARCDSIPDCTDESDEGQCNNCAGNEFHCDRTRCISELFKCDGKQDCRDGTDEQDCEACNIDQFTCLNKKCVPLSFKCDGSNDCGDASDESEVEAGCEAGPTQRTEEKTTKKDEDDGYTYTTCNNSLRKCNLDTDCKTEIDNYRLQCEKQMSTFEMMRCSRECQLAYNRLLSREHGKELITQECTDLRVKNVKLSCIRQPQSFRCHRELQECGENPTCKDLHSRFAKSCNDVLEEHSDCDSQCSQAYNNFKKSSTAASVMELCVELNTTIPIRCPQYEAANNGAAANQSSSSKLGLFVLLLSISLLVTTIR